PTPGEDYRVPACRPGRSRADRPACRADGFVRESARDRPVARATSWLIFQSSTHRPAELRNRRAASTETAQQVSSALSPGCWTPPPGGFYDFFTGRPPVFRMMDGFSHGLPARLFTGGVAHCPASQMAEISQVERRR